MIKNLFLLLLATCSFSLFAEENPARAILEKSIQTTGSSKGCIYLMKGFERIKGKPGLVLNEIFTKVNYSPLKIYAKVLSDPNKGTELLYVKGANSDKIKINPGKFLPTLSLNPFSSMLTKDQHHTLLSSGFMLYTRLIKEGMKRADADGRFDDVFKLEGEVTYNQKKCYKITVSDPTFGYKTVTTQSNDNLYSVTQRLLVPECLVVENNSFVKNFESDLSNKQIKVPTSYSKKSTIYIDKETLYPIFQEMSDENGVFERYEYYNLKVNPSFSADEFTEKFGDYAF